MDSERAPHPLGKNHIYDSQTLSSEISPIGTDLAKLIDQKGTPESTFEPQILITPDKIKVEFTRRTYLAVTLNNQTYSLNHYPDHHLVIVIKLNPNNEPICTLILPTVGELQYEDPRRIRTLYYDHRTNQPLLPLSPSATPNDIDRFYQKTKILLTDLLSSI